MVRVFVERRELPGDLQALLDANVAAFDCTPPLDVVETATGIEILLDVPGVTASEIEVIFARNVVLISGQKRPRACEHGGAAFHVAERAFGRFGRAIRLDGAFDAARATATLAAGELRIALPRQAERRGRQIRIPVR
jgi:HSP20 family protein